MTPTEQVRSSTIVQIFIEARAACFFYICTKSAIEKLHFDITKQLPLILWQDNIKMLAQYVQR